MREIIFTRAGVARGFRECLPLGLSVFAYGLVFGALAVRAGMPPWQAGLMSLTVFAGASQLMALDLWGETLPAAGIILTTLVVNLRHVLMGAAMGDWLTRLPPGRAYGSLFFLTDESWALSMRELGAGGRDAGYLLGSSLCIYVFWFAATMAGALFSALAGSALADPAGIGLDFAFTAVFIALLAAMWRGRGDLWPWLAAGLTAWAASLVLPGKWHILCGGLAGGLTGAWRR